LIVEDPEPDQETSQSGLGLLPLACASSDEPSCPTLPTRRRNLRTAARATGR